MTDQQPETMKTNRQLRRERRIARQELRRERRLRGRPDIQADSAWTRTYGSGGFFHGGPLP